MDADRYQSRSIISGASRPAAGAGAVPQIPDPALVPISQAHSAWCAPCPTGCARLDPPSREAPAPTCGVRPVNNTERPKGMQTCKSTSMV